MPSRNNIPKWVQTALWVILVGVFAVSAILSLLWLTGVIKLQEGYGKVFVGSLVLELIPIAFGAIRSMVGRSRDETHHSDELSIQKRLENFISTANSRIEIFSNSFGWIDVEIQNLLRTKAKQGVNVSLYVPAANPQLKAMVAGSEIVLKEYPKLGIIPSVRFTLLDQDNAGSRRIAVGQGSPPTDFRITVFEESFDPQIVALAALSVQVVDAHIRSTSI